MFNQSTLFALQCVLQFATLGISTIRRLHSSYPVHFASKLTHNPAQPTRFVQVKLLCCYVLQVALLAQRGRAMFRVSVSSFNITTRPSSSASSASDLPLCTGTIQICSVLFFLSWSPMLAVINKIY